MTTIKLIIVGIALATVFYSCSPNNEKKAEEPAVRVETYIPTKVSSDGIFISGMATAKQTAVISTRMMGFVEKMLVKQGDRVREGQLLVVINSDDLKAKKAQADAMVTEAEAAAKNAERDYERFKVLHGQKSVSDKELENVELNKTSMNAKVEMARQMLNEVKAMMAYTNIRAPFSGVVTQKMIEEGSTANPGMPLLTVEQSGEMEIRASVPENYIQYIHVGDSVTVDIKSLNKQLKGVVSELSPSASMTGGQYGIKVAIDNKEKENLWAGMYAGIYIVGKIQSDNRSGILVNKTSVINRDQLTGIYIANAEDQAILRWVRLGKEYGEQVEILSGLSEGERVIQHAEGKLYNGKKVVVSK
ncbi:MAG: efflux RND transporter periplasmic adaptor subunit [Bacteroidales bacterium]